MTPHRQDSATIMEKIAALAVLTALAVVVVFVLGFILVLFLSSADYVRAGEPEPTPCVDPVDPTQCPAPTLAPNTTFPNTWTPVNPGDATGHPGDAFCLIYNCHEQPEDQQEPSQPTLPDTAMAR